MAKTEDKLYKVVSRVFGVPVDQISEDSSPDSIEKWDSLSHISLIISLESEFGVQLSPEQGMEILSVKLARMTLAEHGVMKF